MLDNLRDNQVLPLQPVEEDKAKTSRLYLCHMEEVHLRKQSIKSGHSHAGSEGGAEKRWLWAFPESL